MITLIALSRLIPMKGNYRIMKNKLTKTSHITKNRTRVALLLVLATSIIGLAPAFSSSARADFSINDVSGNYVWHGDGWNAGINGRTGGCGVDEALLKFLQPLERQFQVAG